MKPKNSKEYMRIKVLGVLEALTTDLLLEKPLNVIDFMEDWLAKHGQAVYQSNLRNQMNRPLGVESSESEEDDNSDNAEVVNQKVDQQIRATGSRIRRAVSAEVNDLKDQANLTLITVPKDENTKTLLKTMMKEIFLFNHIDDKEIDTLVNIMHVVNLDENQAIIEQGDPGEKFYIVKSGKLKCIQMTPNGTPELAKIYLPGDYFGELALLYNSPRAATIIAVMPTVLFSLDRKNFTNIVVSSIRKARDAYRNFLREVDIFKTLTPFELERLCDAMKVQNFKEKQVVIEKGAFGKTFYVVLEGRAVAFDEDASTGLMSPVAEYSEKMYFGELALIRKQPRAMYVMAMVI